MLIFVLLLIGFLIILFHKKIAALIHSSGLGRGTQKSKEIRFIIIGIGFILAGIILWGNNQNDSIQKQNENKYIPEAPDLK